MKFNTSLFILVFFLLAQAIFSQQVDLKGRVTDAETSEDIPFATVALYNTGSDSLLDGTTTDWNGRFMLKNVNPGDYRLDVSFIGYANYEIPVMVMSGAKELDLGLLKINQAVVILEAIEITSMARSAVNRLDRVSYRAEDFETARGGTAAELLSRLPSLSVSPDGEVSVRGTTDFVVYLNGRPTQMEPSVLLAQIPASSITGIDIITVPTAGFDAQGKGGIINISTRTQSMDGLSVSASETLGGAPWGNRTERLTDYKLRDDRWVAGINLIYNRKDWVLQGGLNYSKRHVNSNRSGVARILVPGTNIYKHMIASGMKPEWHENLAANLGFEKKLSQRSFVSGSYFFGHRTEGRIAYYLYNNFFGDINQGALPGVPVNEEFAFNPNTGIREGSFNTINIDYSLTPNPGSKLLIGAMYEYSLLTHDVDNPNISYDIASGNLNGKILHYRQNDQTPLHGFRLSVDYSRDLGNEYAISFGLQPQYVYISGTFAYDTLGIPNNDWGSFTSLENEVDLNRFIHAAYVDLAGQINKLKFKAGLRIEYTDQTIDIENPNYFSLFERPAQQRFVVNQPDWFPGFHAAYPITGNDILNFAASRRISRAPVKNMAPFLYRRHLEVYVVGDPVLKPEYINTVELTYNKTIGDQQIGLTGFYRAVNNAIFRVNTVFEDELILIRTFTNAGFTQSLGSELNANFELGRKAKLYLGASLYHFRLDADIFGYRENHRSTNWNLKGNTNLMLSRQLRFVADFNIRSAEITAQGSNKMRYMANAAVIFSPEKYMAWSFNLRALNILNSNTNGISTRAYNSEGTQIFYQDADFYWYGPVAELTISYQFNWRNQTRPKGERSFGSEEF